MTKSTKMNKYFLLHEIFVFIIFVRTATLQDIEINNRFAYYLVH